MRIVIRVACGLALGFLSARLSAQEGDARAPAAKPKTYGVTQLGYYRMSAAEFTPLDTANGSAYTDTSSANFGTAFQRYSTGGPAIFIASPHLPTGALVTYFELDSCDEDPVNDVFAEPAHGHGPDPVGNVQHPLRRSRPRLHAAGEPRAADR